MVDFGEVVLAAIKSVAAAICVLAGGATLARKGILDQALIGRLSQLAKYFFLPCLIFNSVAGGMSPEFVAANWKLALAGLCVFSTGFAFASFVVRFVDIAPDLRAWFVLAVAMPNTIALPLVLLEALCHEQADTQGAAAQCFNGATTRLFTVTLLDNLVFWSFCPNYVKRQTRLAELEMRTARRGEKGESAYTGLVFGPNEPPDDGPVKCVVEVLPPPEEAVEPMEPAGGAQPEPTLLGVPAAGERATGGEGSPPSAAGDDEPGSPSKRKEESGAGSCKTVMQTLRIGLLDSPPVLANLAALAAALTPSVRAALYEPGAPASFIASAISVVGKASPAITSLIAGGSLGLQVSRILAPQESGDASRLDDRFGLRALGVSHAAVALLLVSRIVLVPALNLCLLLLAMEQLPRDRWARLILFFQPAGPTANVVTLLAQLSNAPRGAQLVAVAAVPQMLLYIPMATAFIALGMMWTQGLP